MNEIRFYYLQKTTVYQQLPYLVESVVDMGSVVDICVPQSIVEKISDCLWQGTSRVSFLGHEVWHDGASFQRDSSCILSSVFPSLDRAETANRLHFFVDDMAKNECFTKLPKVYFLFHHFTIHVARSLWKVCDADRHCRPLYYKQSSQGQWQCQ